MDPRSTAPAASSLVLLYANIAKAIKVIAEKYEAAPTTSSIRGECSAMVAASMDIQALLSQPQALSSHVISQVQLAEALKNAQNGCSSTISRLEVEVEKCMGNQTAIGKSPRARSTTHLGDEALIKKLLQQTKRQLTDVSSLVTAAQRNYTLEVRQLLQNDTFKGDSTDKKEDRTDAPTSSEPSGYAQSLSERLDPDSQSSASVSLYNFRSGQSDSYSVLDGDAVSVMSRSQFAPSISDKTKKVPRAQVGSTFFKLFKSNTELHRAAKKGDAKKVQKLLGLGVDVNYDGSSGCTALHLATDSGHEAVVRVLLDNGADPSARSSEGRTPLHSAARTGHTAVVRLLLEKGVDVQAKDPSGSTPLHIAAYNGQEMVVQILLQKHPVVESRGPSGFTALQVAAFNGQSAVVRQLVEMGADIEARSNTGRTALQLAAEKGHEAVVRYLLQHGANVMVKDSSGRTALQGAVSNQHGVVAQLLLDNVVPEGSSQWAPQRGSAPGSTYRSSAVKPAIQMSELAANESPTWSRQVSNAPVFELPASPVGVELVELPAGD